MAAQGFPTDDELRAMAPDHERAHGPHRIMRDQRLRTAVPGRGPGHRRWAPIAVVGVAVTAVLAAIAVFVLPGPVGDPSLTGPGPGPALTTTDPVVVLEELADRAARRTPLPDERYDYVHAVIAGMTGPDDPAPVLVRYELRSWLADDGSARYQQRGLDDVTRGRTGDYDQTNGPLGGAGRLDLPTDPDALSALLATRELADDGSAAGLIRSIGSISEQVVEPQVQASALRMLASRPGVRIERDAVDATGRRGTAAVATLSSDPAGAVSEEALIVDPATGTFLGHRSTLLRGGSLPGPRPQVLMESAVLESDRVDSTDELPG
jgi:hypothetical protein